MSDLYSLAVKTIDGKQATLEPYRGKVLLIVNVASACGLTPHYKGLQELYQDFRARGLEILGFPCNQFGAQEPGTETEIQQFCSLKYNVTFPMFAKIEVNGPNTHPIFKYLKIHKLGAEGKSDIEWNFAKFLVDRQGQVIQRFHPKTEPKDLRAAIEALL